MRASCVACCRNRSGALKKDRRLLQEVQILRPGRALCLPQTTNCQEQRSQRSPSPSYRYQYPVQRTSAPARTRRQPHGMQRAVWQVRDQSRNGAAQAAHAATLTRCIPPGGDNQLPMPYKYSTFTSIQLNTRHNSGTVVSSMARHHRTPMKQLGLAKRWALHPSDLPWCRACGTASSSLSDLRQPTSGPPARSQQRDNV